jgi:hypothetical protein
MTEETLFREALARSPEERAAFLARACAGQPKLLAAVQALLAAHEQSSSLLDNPAADSGPTVASAPAQASGPGTGQRFRSVHGRYWNNRQQGTADFGAAAFHCLERNCSRCAFKRDWGTVDCICLAIATTDRTATEVNEEMEGWEALTEALHKYLPGSKLWSECFFQVAFPAFATNETVIFDRKSSPEASKYVAS